VPSNPDVTPLVPRSRDTGTGAVDAAWEAHFRHLEERIDRLDRTVGAAVDLLHRLLHPDKQPPQPLVKPGNAGR